MRARITNKIILLLITVFFAVLLVAPVVSAQQATSSNFTMSDSSFDSYSGGATSSSFSELPSGGYNGSDGESTSTSYQLSSGFLYFDTFTPEQQNWRWYGDETDETPTAPLASENVAPVNIENLDAIKLRVAVAETAGFGADNLKFRLQFATSSDFSSGANDVAESADCIGSSGWCYATGAGADNSIITTAVLSDSDSCVSSVGDGCGTHNTSGTTTSTFTQAANAVTEYEFTIQESGASPNTVYFFRLFDTDTDTPVPLYASATYPSLSSEGTSLTFTIGGLASSTMDSGTTTTVDTTPTSVPFGALLTGASAIGAQRLTVSTDASQGYEIFSYAQQGLVGSSNEQIPPVLGTNEDPLGWSTGCSATSTGCYGYHTSEAVLSGNSTRFAPDDTYAQFSTTSLSEVAFSAGATTSKTTDIVYKTEVHNGQPADAYSTSVVYIIVPTF